MKPYTKYKASGVEWIGDIPEHWEVMSIRRITDDHKQGYYSSDGYKTNGYKLVRITDLDENGNIDISNSPHVSPTEKELEIFQIKKGDILFPRTGSIGLVGIAKVNLNAVFASYLIRFRFNNQTEISFMRYFFISDVFLKGLLSDLHGGVNQNIHAENIKNQTIFLPPLPEQTAIANFLDRKTTELDTLIANKQSLIELLKEERTAIINHAITKGINPNVKYKDSGIEWIGEIPEHWEVRNLQDVAKKDKYSFTGGPFGSDLKFNDYTENGVRIIQLQNIGVGEFKDDYKIYTSEGKANQLFSCNIFPNEIIVAKMADPVARACKIPQSEGRFLMASDGIRISVDEINYNNDFILQSINSNYFRIQAELNSSGTTRLRIGLNELRKLKIILPPLPEQLEIANFIEAKTSEIDTIISQTEKEIELLKEYKTALISEVVLGKVDVREEVLAY